MRKGAERDTHLPKFVPFSTKLPVVNGDGQDFIAAHRCAPLATELDYLLPNWFGAVSDRHGLASLRLLKVIHWVKKGHLAVRVDRWRDVIDVIVFHGHVDRGLSGKPGSLQAIGAVDANVHPHSPLVQPAFSTTLPLLGRRLRHYLHLLWHLKVGRLRIAVQGAELDACQGRPCAAMPKVTSNGTRHGAVHHIPEGARGTSNDRRDALVARSLRAPRTSARGRQDAELVQLILQVLPLARLGSQVDSRVSRSELVAEGLHTEFNPKAHVARKLRLVRVHLLHCWLEREPLEQLVVLELGDDRGQGHFDFADEFGAR
mmetsp:Transcript_10817/g.34502  ORF Transcript_10817/g.34502 Transcript_10817/m.34502 type:complete len:316 (+) Transcript_10817:3588-4535(+)